MNEKELVNALKQKDSEAFKIVYEQYYSRLKHLCYGMVHNSEDAEDLVQEVFIDLFDSISRFREEASLSTWLHRIAINKSYKLLRSKKVRDIFSRLDYREIQCPDKTEDEDIKSKQIDELHNAIKALPERQAKVFTLFFYENIPQKEIADILELSSVSAVEQLIFRAKQNIKKSMKFEDND
ncbi:MAG: RNA polymerase sigma factor [Bacteroidales bacterium]|nr:RNA polymerase sigma factor [Bacteroidales bacterium]MBR5777042.1 RNA polymerase sigma factor [Bacteroidales bacterium]